MGVGENNYTVTLLAISLVNQHHASTETELTCNDTQQATNVYKQKLFEFIADFMQTVFILSLP